MVIVLLEGLAIVTDNNSLFVSFIILYQYGKKNGNSVWKNVTCISTRKNVPPPFYIHIYISIHLHFTLESIGLSKTFFYCFEASWITQNQEEERGRGGRL